MAPDNGETADPTAADPSGTAVANAEAAAQAAKARAAAARERATELRRKADEARTAEIEAAEVAKDAKAAEADATDVGVAAEGSQPAAVYEALAAPAADKVPASVRRSPWPVLAAVVGAFALCGLIGASGFLVHAHRQTELNEQRSAEYTAAARQGVVNIMAINFNTADADVQRVLESATGDFKQDFQSSSKDLISALEEAKVVTEVSVEGVAVESMTPDSAVVLVAATSQRGNTDAKNRDPRTWRVVVSLAREGDQLKVSKVDYV